jgi:hypothetical protein
MDAATTLTTSSTIAHAMEIDPQTNSIFCPMAHFQRCSEAQVDVTVLVGKRDGVSHLELET